MIKQHIQSIFNGKRKWDKDRIVNAIALFRIRKGRGISYTGEIEVFLRYASMFIPTFLLLKVPLLATLIIGIIISVSYFAVSYFIGYIDMEKVKVMEREAVITSIDVNPVFKKLVDDIEEIKGKLK